MAAGTIIREVERSLPRDRGLVLRTVGVLFLLSAFYGGIGFALWLPAAYEANDGSARLRVVWALGIGFVVWMLARIQLILANTGALSRVRASWIASESEPELVAAVARIAALANVPPPRIAISSLRAPNALALGSSRKRRTIVVTRSLLDTLTPEEVEAVLAHEMTHIVNRDAALMTAATSFRALAFVLGGDYMHLGPEFRSSGLRLTPTLVVQLVPGVIFSIVLAPIRWLLVGIGGLCTLTLSRYREYVADRGSAILTGRPETLMSALVKLAGTGSPAADLRGAGLDALWIVPVRQRRGYAWLSDHPPLEHRLRQLDVIAREMGRARPSTRVGAAIPQRRA